MDNVDHWENRRDNMVCATCIFFVLKRNQDPKGQIGRCRKRAPTLGGYPVVYKADWCGDHKLDENKLDG